MYIGVAPLMVSDNWEEIVEELVVKLVENEDEFEGAIAVRFRVFVAEQSIPPEEELDEDDATAIHAIALVHGQVVGTGRLVSRDDGDGQVGRMAASQ
jgi:predicted GNAT family N-acyltransferase